MRVNPWFNPFNNPTYMSEKLKVLVVGSGGREHALLRACKRSPLVSDVFAAPGNGGMAADAHCFGVGVGDLDGMVALAREQGVTLAIVGPENPLCDGLVDALQAAGIPAYGPDKASAQLEASKDFTKNFLFKYNIPTGASESFTELAPALEYLRTQPCPIVIKASGLAAGKGVIIAQTQDEAEAALRDMLEGNKFGEAGATVLVEEYLDGEEASIHCMIGNGQYLMLPASQDHKRVGEGDTGPNTGGMGAYAPAAVVTPEIEQQVRERIVEPTVAGLQAEGLDFRGTLFIGIMIVNGVAKVLEFNVRFGDPETQVLLPLLETDPVAIMRDIAHGTFTPQEVKIRDGYAMVVVMAAGGYPEVYRKGDEIAFPDTLPDNADIIHAGTKLVDGRIVTNGGRVLGVTGYGASLKEAAATAYGLVDQVTWQDANFRRDIGHRQLKREG